MSGQFTGMDIGQVRQLANLMRNKADEIESIMNELTRQLGSTSWIGNDRQQFESDWSGQHCNSLRNVANGIRDAATRADQNAAQQESASA